LNFEKRTAKKRLVYKTLNHDKSSMKCLQYVTRHDEFVMIKGFINSTPFCLFDFSKSSSKNFCVLWKKGPRKLQVYETLNHDKFIMTTHILETFNAGFVMIEGFINLMLLVAHFFRIGLNLYFCSLV
jgi:hypothetical protein